jgi:hypothetical protein
MKKILILLFLGFIVCSCKSTSHGCDAYGDVKQKEIKKIS